MRIRSVAKAMGSLRSAEAQAHLVTFGRNVRELRTRRGMTQEQLAEAAGFHRTIVGFIERAEREVGVSHLWPLAAALEADISEFFVEATGGSRDPRG